MMIYNVFSPSIKLQNIVKQYVVISSLEGMEKLLFLPNGGNFMVFNRGFEGHMQAYNGEELFTIPQNYSISVKTNRVKKFILNNQTSSKTINFPIILVELMPIGYYKLFKQDASLLNTGYLELDQDIIEKYFINLYTHDNVKEEIKYLNKSINALNVAQNNTRLCIEDVVMAIIDSYDFEVSVKGLLAEFNCSRSTMERQFKKVIGFTPKKFIFISKFCKTVLAYVEDECTFNDLKYLYSDGSHLNVVFQKFLGTNPSMMMSEVANDNIQIYQMQNLKKG